MKIEIDQSGKIEDTGKDTIVAFSNGISGSILILAKDKREIQNVFRQGNKSRIFVYKLFSLLIFILIKPHISKIDEIVIDTEYPGKSAIIKDFLLREIRKANPKFQKENISFGNIGKKSRAHQTAYKAFKKKSKVDKTVSLKDILKNLL